MKEAQGFWEDWGKVFLMSILLFWKSAFLSVNVKYLLGGVCGELICRVVREKSGETLMGWREVWLMSMEQKLILIM